MPLQRADRPATNSNTVAVAVAVAPLAAILLITTPAWAADVHFTGAAATTTWTAFPSGGFEGGSANTPTSRAIYDRANTGQSAISGAGAPKTGQLVFLAPYTGHGFDSPAPFPVGTLTIYGIDGLGIDNQVNQQITLPDRIALAGDQEWRINSDSGSIRQLNIAAARNIGLGSSMLTLNAVNAANAFFLDNPIIGTGGIVVAGAGTTTLTGANTYSGGTFFKGGTLSVSQDNNLGAASGGLDFDGGVLRVTGIAYSGTARSIHLGEGGGRFDIADAANTFSLNQALSGSGALFKLGAGTLTLNAGNTYTGSTTIQSGALALAGAGSLAASSGVQNNGVFDISGTSAGASIRSLSGIGTVNLGVQTLTLTSAHDTFSGAFQGMGDLVLSGGTEILTGDSSGLTGATTVQAGQLVVNGSLANSATTVHNSATLAGNGTVGATTIQSGGTIAPGNSLGTLHVNGDFNQSAGALYQVQVNPASNESDLIEVTGAANLANGALLNVTKVTSGDYRVGAEYKVLSATGGVNGTYSLAGEIAPISAFLGLQDTYDANNVYLRVMQTRDPGDAAETPNQGGTAGGVGSLPTGNPIKDGVLNSPTDGDARRAFDQLSGEALASAQGMLVSGSMLVRDTTINRLRDVFCAIGHTSASEKATAYDTASTARCAANPERTVVWQQAIGDWGHADGHSGVARIDQSTSGLLIGADVPLDEAWRVGVFTGYSHTDFDLNDRESSGDNDSYHLGTYGGTQWGALILRMGGSYSWNNIETRRSVAFGNFSNRLHADYDAGMAQVFTELGYQLYASKVVLEPFANLAYVNLRTDGFSESGGDAALHSRADTTSTSFTTLGVRPSFDVSLGSLDATLQGMLGWRHAFGDVNPSSTVSFAGSDTFTIEGAPVAKDMAVMDLGMGFNITHDTMLAVTYGGQFSDDGIDQSVRGSLTITF